MDASKNALKYSESSFGPGYLFKGGEMSPYPGIASGFIGSGASELGNSVVQEKQRELTNEASLYFYSFWILVYSAARCISFILVVWLVSTHPLSMLEIVKYGELGILVGAWGLAFGFYTG